MATVTRTARVATDIPEDLADQLAERAKSNERSVSAELRVAIRAHLAKPDYRKAATG